MNVLISKFNFPSITSSLFSLNINTFSSMNYSCPVMLFESIVKYHNCRVILFILGHHLALAVVLLNAPKATFFDEWTGTIPKYNFILSAGRFCPPCTQIPLLTDCLMVLIKMFLLPNKVWC